MKAIGGFLAGFLVAIGVHAVRAVDLEIAVGRSEFCCLQDGVWWQESFNGSTRVGAVEIGARHRFGDGSLHLAYLDMGTANGLNVATMRDDDFGRFNTTKGCDTATQRNCLGYFGTRQHIAGVLAGAAYGFEKRGVRLEIEGGQFFYQSDMQVAIWCPNCGLDQRYAFGAGGTFTSSSDLRRSHYGALRATYKGFTLTYRRFQNIDGSGSGRNGEEAQFATGLTNGPVNQLMVGVAL